MRSVVKEEVSRYAAILLGSLLFCAGLNLFIVPVGLYNGGTVGIAQIIRTLLAQKIELPSGFDIAGILNFILNIPLLILAYTKIGKQFFIRTVYSVLTQTILFSIIPIPVNPILGERLAACLIGGIMAGAGVGVTLRAGGSGGGVDVLGVYLTKTRKNFSVGKLTLLFNSVVYGICALVFSLPVAIYSIIYCAAYSVMADRVHLQQINITAIIFTKKARLYDVITREMRRGTTYWKATGGYTDTDTYVVVSVISKYEIPMLRHLLNQEDPNAFVIINEGPQIIGNYEVRL